VKRTMKQKAEKKVQKKDLNYYLNLRYKVEIVPFNEEDGGGYEARIPQLGREAFRGYGDTIEEALAHLEVVKRDLFEMYLRDGVEIPEPEKEEERYSGRILLRIPFYLHEELSKLAKEQDISLNQLLNHLIERGLASLKYENQVETISQTVLRAFNKWQKPSYRINVQSVDFIPQGTINENEYVNEKSLC